MGIMAIMGKEGDIKVEWDADKDKEVKAAEKQFDKLVSDGFIPFRQYDGGKKGEKLNKFDKFAEKILFLTPVMGG